MPIQQHPVPQQISTYEFRLIGEMTLKQFGWLSGGALLGLFFFSLPLASLFKWPLVLLSVFAGFAFAFLPVEERPLPTWIAAFFKAVFSPTIFVWKKRSQVPDLFLYQPKPILQENKNNLPVTDRKKLYQYLQTLNSSQNNALDQQEKELLNKFLNLFPKTTEPQKPTPPPIPKFPEKPEETIMPVQKDASKKTKPQPDFYSGPRSFYSYSAKPPIEQLISYWQRKKREEEEKKLAKEAKTNKALPFPNPPSVPNLVVGMVLGPEDEMIEGALIEISDSQGIPVRALKTNKLGQFRIATPLPNGTYEISVEKEGYKFDIIKLEAKGEIINPLEIRGQKINET